MIKALIAGTLAVVAAFVIAKGSIAHAQTDTPTTIPTATVMPSETPAATTTMTPSVTPAPTRILPSGAPQTGFGPGR